MVRGQRAALLAVFLSQANTLLADEVCECQAEKPELTTVTFTVVATVEPSAARWDQLLDHICLTPWPADKGFDHHQGSKGHQGHQHKKITGGHSNDDGYGNREVYDDYGQNGCQIQYLDAYLGSSYHRYHGNRHTPHWMSWYPDSQDDHDWATRTDTWSRPTHSPSWSTGIDPSMSSTATEDDDAQTSGTSSSTTPDGDPTATDASSTADPDPTDISSTTTTSTSSSASPTSSACDDLINGSFDGNVVDPWYISEEVTADSMIIEDGPDGIQYSYALIPSQQQYAQVYLNQQLPRCGDPPPLVDIQVSFRYKFTGESEGCSIAGNINREPTDFFIVEDDGQSPGVWQEYQGPVTSVQLTYDPLFTLKLVCDGNTANTPAIQVTDVSVY